MRHATCVALLLTCTALAGFVSAEDKEKAKADPTGTWKWSFKGQDGQSRESTLKLKLDGEKLTGTMVGRDSKETAIDDAALKDNEVTFSYTRERNGQKFTSKYKGKLDGDVIKGTIESERDGKTNSREWEAKREKEEKK